MFSYFVVYFTVSLFVTKAQDSGFEATENGPKPSFEYSPYYKGPVCTPSHPIQHPQSIKEVQKIVKTAIGNGKTVKAFGVLHSATDIVCTNGIPIDMTGIKGMVINDTDFSVTVGAGVTLFDLAEFLKMNGRGLKTTPGFGNITIGGAIGTGAHGSSIKFTSSISEQVIGLTIIDGLGNVRNITEVNDLRGFRVHLGLLGVIVGVTLRTEPIYKVRGHNYVVSDRILADGSFKDIVLKSDQISLYWFPSAEVVVIANWTIVDVNARGEAWTNDHVPSTYFSFNYASIVAMETAHALEPISPYSTYLAIERLQSLSMETLLRTIPDFAPIYTYDGVLVSNPAIGYYHRMFAPICYDKGILQCPWLHGPANMSFVDNEFSVDMNLVPHLFYTVKDILGKYPAAFPMQGILLRFSAASETYMSTAYGRNTCHFEFYLSKRLNFYQDATAGLAAYQTILQSILFEYGGQSHWGKSGAIYHSTENIARNLNFEAKKSFLSLMNKYDPHGIFLNDFGRRLLGTGTKMDVDPLVTHCALLDNCFCKFNRDCARGQRCRPLDGYPNYPACINRPLIL